MQKAASPPPCSFGACTKQLSLTFLEGSCNLGDGREHLGVECITKSNNSSNNNREAVKAQGCCDFEHALVRLSEALLQLWEASGTSRVPTCPMGQGTQIKDLISRGWACVRPVLSAIKVFAN